MESGKRLQGELGVEIKPFDEQANGDFVDAILKSYDTMGMPNAYEYWTDDGGQFLNQVDGHLNKSVDQVVINLNGTSIIQQQQILDYVENSNNPNFDNIIFIGN